jgi:hypothetical protein
VPRETVRKGSKGPAAYSPTDHPRAHFFLRIPANFTLGALLVPLFGQFLRGILGSSLPYRTLEGRSVLRRPAFRHSSTLITTTHSVIIVGKMIVAILVNPMDSPV